MDIKNKTKAEVIDYLERLQHIAKILGMIEQSDTLKMAVVNLSLAPDSLFKIYASLPSHSVDFAITAIQKKVEEVNKHSDVSIFSKDWDELLESKIFECSQDKDTNVPISAVQQKINALKHHPSIVEDQHKTLAFTNVIPADMAQRLIGDLEHIVEHTNDEKYISALQAEIKRLGYIAKGEITKPSDVNYAWTISI
ncbi:hypothetical protein F9Z84_06610 [Escherichia coli]|nr:hypothetical protein F9Z84_06610 [Escherichia coli]